MNKLNIETVKIRTSYWDYNAKAMHTKGIVEKIGVRSDLYDQTLKDIADAPLLPFTEGKKVFFHNSVVFSRVKFRETFPNNKITYKIENADLVIIDKDNIQEKYNVNGPNLYRQRKGASIHPLLFSSIDGEDVYVENNDTRNPHLTNPVVSRGHFIYLEHSFSGKGIVRIAEIEELNQLIDYAGKLTSVDSIDLKSEVMLEEESYQMLEKLLGSKMDANLQMAVTMLSGFDYSSSKQRIACLLFKHWDAWRNFYDKKVHIGLKTMFVRLYKEFPHILSDSASRREPAFWFNLLSLYYKDPIIDREFAEWSRTFIDCPCDNLEVVVRVRDEQQIQVLELTSKIEPCDFSYENSDALNDAESYIYNQVTNEQDEKGAITLEETYPF